MAKHGRTSGLRPGNKAPDSGQYSSSKTGGEVTSERGERLPPGPKGTTYKLVDRTQHPPKRK